MLRKHTSFFDSTLGQLSREAHTSYEDACRVRDRLAKLIQDLSGYWDLHTSTDSCLEICFENTGNGSFSEERIREFEKAARDVYRLETLFRYPWEDDPQGDVCCREICLDFSFFKKNSKKPFFKMVFHFSVHTGVAHDRYWGAWPPTEAPSKTTK